MAAPDFVALTELETDSGKPLRQALLKKVKDDFDNLHERVGAIESASGIFDHFNSGWDSSAAASVERSWPIMRSIGNTGVEFTAGVPPWIITTDNPDGIEDSTAIGPNQPPPAYSVRRIRSVNTSYAAIQSALELRFDQATLPIIFEGRFRNESDNPFRVGMMRRLANFNPSTDGAGVWLERVDATNWRFATYNTARNNGVSFARPSTFLWYVVKIEFTDAPSNRVLCSIDGVLKDTISSQLPTAIPQRASWAAISPSATLDIDVDRVKFAAPGLADAP